MVDERPRAAGAVAVHTQVGGAPVAEEHHFGVLSADVDQRARGRIMPLHGFSGRHNFLDERQAVLLGETHAHRPRHPYAYRGVAYTAAELSQYAGDSGLRVGVVPLVAREQHSSVIAYGYDFGRSRTYVDTYPDH